MSSETLIRWSGLALAVGGIGIAGFVVATLPIGGLEASVEQTLSATYLLAHGLHTVGGVFALFGLMGLYIRQMDESGWLGLIGFVVAFIGTALFVGLGMISEFISPLVAAEAPGLMEKGGALEDPAKLVILPISIVIFIVGYILLGIATFRANVFPRWSGLVLVVGAVLFFPPLPWPIPVVGAVVYGLALLWLGYALWSGRPEGAAQAEPAG